MDAPAVALVGCTVKTSLVAAAGVIVNATLAVPLRPLPLAEAASVYPDAALSMLSAPNVATPATAACVGVPASVPPAGLVPIATVTFPANPVALLPKASSAVTSTAGVIGAPAGASLGCTVNTSCCAAAGVMANAALAVVNPLADAVNV